MDIDKLIHSLGAEIKKTESGQMKEDQMVRLQEVAATYKGEDQVETFETLLEMELARAAEKVISTGYKGLDTILKGFIPSQLIVVSAATKSGKTTFCMEIANKMPDEHPLWLSFEESIAELLTKFKEHHGVIPDGVSPLSMKGNTLEWVEKKIIEAKVKYGTGIVFIDHLHFIVPFAAERQDLAIGHAMRELKRMARQWNVVVVLIAHIKKARVDRSPTLEDLRDSSFIAQEADTVIMLYRHAFRDDEGDMSVTNNVNVAVLANRRTGKTGNVKMVFDNGRFLEKDWRRSEVEVGNSWAVPFEKDDDS